MSGDVTRALLADNARMSTVLIAPLQARVVAWLVDAGARVRAGQPLVILEAMKMEQPLKAHKAGVVTALSAEVGATVTQGAVLCEIKDA